MNVELQDQIWTIDNFLSNDECEKYVKSINEKSQLRPFTISGKFKNDRYNDGELATSFFEKITKCIDIPILRSNNLIMTGKYKPGDAFGSPGLYLPGDAFGLHTDTGLHFDLVKCEKSNYTLLIYLNDNFEGGKTVFYDNQFQKTIEIEPKKGKALLFDIDLWHKGEEIHKGEKFWIGCEIISKFRM